MSNNSQTQVLLAGGDMSETLATQWFYTLNFNRYSIGSLWTGTPTGTLYVQVGVGSGILQLSMNVIGNDFLSSMLVTDGQTTDDESQWFVSGGNDWPYMRYVWVPTGTTTGTMTGVYITFKTYG